MSVDALVTTLKSMKLHGMAGAITELAEQGSPAFKQSGELLEKLIKAEVAERVEPGDQCRCARSGGEDDQSHSQACAGADPEYEWPGERVSKERLHLEAAHSEGRARQHCGDGAWKAEVQDDLIPSLSR